MVDIDLSKYKILLNQSYEKKLGKVAKVVGVTVESIGPAAKLNDLCHIITQDKDQVINAEVVGFRDDRVLLMPYDQTVGVGLGSRVENTGAPLKVMVGDELLGKVLDGLGNPIDGSEIHCSCGYSVQAQPPDPLTRELIDTVLPLGVKAVDGLITVGKGQRIGIFAGSGVGKSTLMGMFARNTKADINVIALIGERGREVREFIERDLGPEGMKRSVVVVATSDKPALIRKKAAMTATAVAEYFRSRKRRSFDDGFPDTFFYGTERDWTCFRRAAGIQRISAKCLWRDATASGEGGAFRQGFHYRIVHRPGRW